MKLRLASACVLAGITLGGFQQRTSPEQGKAGQKSTQTTQAGTDADKQSSKARTTGQPPAQPTDKNPNGAHGNGKQDINISVATPKESVDSVERIISIIGLICTVALSLVGVVGICIALKTLRQMKGQRRAMVEQLRAMRRQVGQMQRQASEMEKQTRHLEGSVAAAQTSANAAKTSADIAAGVAIPKLVIHEVRAGNAGAAALTAMLQLPKMELVLKNYGQTPALLRSWSILFTCEELPHIPVYSGQPGCGIALTHEVIKPNEPYTLNVEHHWNRQGFSLDDVLAIIDNRKILNAYGYVCYRDIFGNPLQRFKFFATALNMGDSWIEWRTEAAPDAYVGTDTLPAPKKHD